MEEAWLSAYRESEELREDSRLVVIWPTEVREGNDQYFATLRLTTVVGNVIAFRESTRMSEAGWHRD